MTNPADAVAASVEHVIENVEATAEAAIASAEARADAAQTVADNLADAAIQTALGQRITDLEEGFEEWQNEQRELVSTLQSTLATTQSQLTAALSELSSLAQHPKILAITTQAAEPSLIPAGSSDQPQTEVIAAEVISPAASAGDLPAVAAEAPKRKLFRLT